MAQLVHTLKLLNEDYITGIHNLIHSNIEVDCVITKLNVDYVKQEDAEDITAEDVTNFVNMLSCVARKGSHLYLELPHKEYLSVVKEGILNSNHYIFKNTLILPTDAIIEECSHCPMARYIDSDVKFVIFACNGHHARNLRDTSHNLLKDKDCMHCECHKHYLSNWTAWFHKPEIEAYRVMAKISAHPGEIILDPFMGNGDIGSMIYKSDRNYIGMEKDIELYREAVERLDEQGE